MMAIVKVILKRKKYALIALAATSLMFSATYYLTVATIARKSIIVYAQMSGVFFTAVSLLFSLILSVFAGVYLALFVFKRDLVRSKDAKSKVAGFTGAVSGLVASGCPTCGAALLAIAGFPLGLMVFPFKGLELKLLGIILLGFSIYFLVKGIRSHVFCEECVSSNS